MIGDLQFKVCGLTRAEDAVAAASAGADFLGFIFYEKSLRRMTLADFRAIRAGLPNTPRVAVSVLPEMALVEEWLSEGFDFVQIHFSQATTTNETLEAYSRVVGREKLWVAPKIAPGEAFRPEMLEFADTVLWDTYKKDAYGGTGHTGDWAGFGLNRERFPEKRFILAGGLGPSNVVEAAQVSGAKTLDMGSGVEISPGIKDPKKLQAVSKALQSLIE